VCLRNSGVCGDQLVTACGCRVVGERGSPQRAAWLMLAALGFTVRRRRNGRVRTM
jgi:MYXO-CTERM domain-containing protein